MSVFIKLRNITADFNARVVIEFGITNADFP